MKMIAGFGEVLLRLKAPGYERLPQCSTLEVFPGGAELNVMASLTQFGHETRMITVLPRNELGEAALFELRGHGVDGRHVLRRDGRMGLYFYEAGSNIRSAKVVYDRAGSAFASIRPGIIDWQASLQGIDWLHLTGITSSLGEAPAAVALEAARVAHSLGIKVSLDVNFRAQLWAAAPEMAQPRMKPFLDLVSCLFASAQDGELCFGMAQQGESPADRFDHMAGTLLASHSGLEVVVTTFRSGGSADDNSLSAAARSRSGRAAEGPVEVRGIIDRIGAGDAFAAGFIHGQLKGWPLDRALRFGLAASALKHTVPGDINRVSEAEVEAAIAGNSGGRVQR